VAETAEAMKAAGFPPAAWVDAMLATGYTTFYQYDGKIKVGVYNPARGVYEPFQRDPSMVILSERKAAGKVINKNPSATMIDLGDGVACVEFHTKMNALDTDITSLILQALDCAETDFDGLVIATRPQHFMRAANLFVAVMAAQSGMWDQIDAELKKVRACTYACAYFPSR